jgi:hypothetical protein
MNPNETRTPPPPAKTPPLLLGAALVFWGWQSGFFLAGALMALVLESARVIKARWDLADEDFSRIWTFCILLALAASIYAFTSNEGPDNFSKLFQTASAADRQDVSNTSVRTATAILRWLPMVMFLFVAAQVFNLRESVPLQIISLLMRRRWRKARLAGNADASRREVNVTYPYFILCIFAASVHPNDGSPTFFAGLCGLVAWALWVQRPRRFGWPVWAGVLLLVMAIGYGGQEGLSRLERLVEGYNAQWLERFMSRRTDPTQSVTALGQIGRMKLSGQIVIRLKTLNDAVPPEYLREASYLSYHSQIWHVGTARDDFTQVAPEPDGTTWNLLSGITNPAAVNIACYLDGGKALLPLPTGSRRLKNFNAYVLQKNSAGAVLAEGPGLVIFDAEYGPGATMDAPADNSPSATNLDLAVPADEIPALKQVIAEMKVSGQDETRTLQTVSRFFSDKFQYSLWQGRDKLARANETVLGRFLLHSRSGHCEYFATATVLLLRELGIPARYAVGYAVHEGSGHKYVVRERDAHAWCLVWDKQDNIWRDFDTTPGTWVAVEAKRASIFEGLSDAWSWVTFQISKFRWGQGNVRQYILWALIPVLLVLLGQIIFQRGKRRRLRLVHETAPAPTRRVGTDSEFYQLETKLAEFVRPRQPGEALTDWLARTLENPALAGLREPLQELLRLHYRHRFDPPGLSPVEREDLRREVKVCLVALSGLTKP